MVPYLVWRRSLDVLGAPFGAGVGVGVWIWGFTTQLMLCLVQILCSEF